MIHLVLRDWCQTIERTRADVTDKQRTQFSEDGDAAAAAAAAAAAVLSSRTRGVHAPQEVVGVTRVVAGVLRAADAIDDARVGGCRRRGRC